MFKKQFALEADGSEELVTSIRNMQKNTIAALTIEVSMVICKTLLEV